MLVQRPLACCPSTPGGLGGGFGRFDDFPLSSGGANFIISSTPVQQLELAERRCLKASAAVRVVA